MDIWHVGGTQVPIGCNPAASYNYNIISIP